MKTTLLLIAAFVAVLALIAVAAEELPICDQVKATNPNGGRLAEWVGYDQGGWKDMPDDLRPVFAMPADFQATYYEMYSPSKRQLWLFVFWSLTYSGDPPGNHDICEVIIYDLKRDT